MLEIAVKMLLGDKVKYSMLITSLAFATFLITQQIGIFCGIMGLTMNLVENTNVPLWVITPRIVQVNQTISLRDIELYKVRSVPGIEWAVPLYHSITRADLYTDQFLTVLLIGVDSETLVGLPPTMIKGERSDLEKENSVIIDEIGLKTLSEGLERPLDIGDVFTINGHELKIVGINDVSPSFFGYPTIYTTYQRAIEINPVGSNNMGYILAQPEKGTDMGLLKKTIREETGLRAFTDEEISWTTMWWITTHVGLPISFGITICLGFIIGMAVSAQTFYSFINENLSNIGALKAMGISNLLLQSMLLAQAAIAGFIGYGIGIFFSSIFGVLLILVYKIAPASFPIYFYIPFYLPWNVFWITIALIITICSITAYIGIQKVNKLDPAEVFRA